MLLCTTVMGQSASIADAVVGTSKTTIAGLLGAELSLRKKQGELIKDLEDTEEDYDSKRNVLANFKTSTLVVGAVQAQFVFLSSKISDIRTNISTLKIASFGIGHGLTRYQKALETEEGYLAKLQEENLLLGGGVLISGGTGHVYTAYLKLLIRIVTVKNKILQIDKEIKAKMKVTRIFAK